jgi:hypothetical protein
VTAAEIEVRLARGAETVLVAVEEGPVCGLLALGFQLPLTRGQPVAQSTGNMTMAEHGTTTQA